MKWWVLVLVAIAGCDQTFGFSELPRPSDAHRDSAGDGTRPDDGAGDAASQGSWQKVSVGTFGTCAVSTSGRLACWTTGTNGPPTYIDTNTDWSDIAVGENHACGIRSHLAYCWGANASGQVNGAPSAPVTTPQHVMLPATSVTQIGVGFLHTCALTGTDTGARAVFCWGNGPAVGGSSGGPYQMSDADGITQFDALAVGWDHSCAKYGGNVYCWGGNTHGQAVPGAGTTNAPTLVDLSAFGPVDAIAAGYFATCVLGGANGGSLECWGVDSVYLSAGNTHMDLSQTPVGTNQGWLTVALGNHVMCATANGEGSCWGAADNGGLPDQASSTTISPNAPLLATVPADAVSLEVSSDAQNYPGAEHACALHQGEIRCWSPDSAPHLVMSPP